MGLIGPDEVTALLQIARGTNFGALPGDSAAGRFTADRIDTLTIPDIVRLVGPRTRSFAASTC